MLFWPICREHRRWVTLGIVSFVLLFLIVGGFLFVGNFIAAERTPHKSDIGVILAGGYTRAMYASDLYHQGLIPMIWVTRPKREREMMLVEALGIPYPHQEDVSKAVLLKKRVPGDRIELIGEGVASTIEEARLVASLLADHHELRSVLVITSQFHVRRAEAIFQFILRASPQVMISVVGTPYDGFVANRWWTDRDSAREVLLETSKLVLFWIRTEF